MKKKKMSMFKKGFIIYIAVLLVVILFVDIFVWSKLSKYEKAENAKAQEAIDKAANATPTSTPTPTPVPTHKVRAYIPKDAILLVDGEYTQVERKEPEDKGELEGLYTFINNYSEYKDLPSKINIPLMDFIELDVKDGSVVSAKDSIDKDLPLEVSKDKDGIETYKAAYVSDDSMRDSVAEFAFKMAVDYSLFCANDRYGYVLNPYFPNDSQYLKTILSLDNSWYTKHEGEPTFHNQKVEDYFGYSENLFYISIAMDQNMYATYYGGYLDVPIHFSLWIVKLGDSYKVAGIVY